MYFRLYITICTGGVQKVPDDNQKQDDSAVQVT